MEVVSFLLAPETKSTFKKSKRRFQKTTPFLKNSLSGRLLTNGADTHTNISDHILILRLLGEQGGEETEGGVEGRNGWFGSGEREGQEGEGIG